MNDNSERVSDCLHSKEVLMAKSELEYQERDRIRGMIAGNVLGDMLGYPMEGGTGMLEPYPPLKITHRCVRDIEKVFWTDDTAMLLALGASMDENSGKVNPESERKHYVKWFLDGDYTPDGIPYGYGKTTREAILKGNPVTDRLSNGNGALMRSSIISAYYIDKTDSELQEASGISCSVTHGHPVSIFTNIIYNFLLKKILTGYSLSKGFKLAKEKYYDIMPDTNEIFQKPVFYSVTPYCVTTLQTAIFVNLESESFEEALVKSVNLGGDTDTIGAVTGAIAGAIYGFDGIKSTFKEKISIITAKYSFIGKFFE